MENNTITVMGTFEYRCILQLEPQIVISGVFSSEELVKDTFVSMVLTREEWESYPEIMTGTFQLFNEDPKDMSSRLYAKFMPSGN